MSTADYTAAYDQFRALLKKLREEKGLSQSQLAEKLEVPQSYVSKYETGERRLDFIETLEICSALGVEASTIVRNFQSLTAKQTRRRRTR